MKSCSKFLCLVLLVALGVSVGYGWGNATHVYFAKQLGVKGGLLDYNEMYGALLPDLFNLEPGYEALANAFHFNTDAMLYMYGTAPSVQTKAAAYGFLSHNNAWGVDFTAHGTDKPGWVIKQGNKFGPNLVPYLIGLLGPAIPPGYPYTAPQLASVLAPAMGHDLVETSVDILVRRNQDPAIGVEMYTAADGRSGDVPAMVAAVFGLDPGAFAAAEEQYRQGMMMYGGIFAQPDEESVIQAMAALSANVGAGYIKAQTGLDVTINAEDVVGFIRMAIDQVNPGYYGQLVSTLNVVEKNFKLNRIAPVSSAFAAKSGNGTGSEFGERNVTPAVPTTYAMEQNYPNPFNPSTRISYALPSDVPVTLKVYNSIGQEVATLVDGLQPAGVHQAVWDAKGLPSGVYIYRLNAGTFVETKKMTLMK
jgi:hypothetical protein